MKNLICIVVAQLHLFGYHIETAERQEYLEVNRLSMKIKSTVKMKTITFVSLCVCVCVCVCGDIDMYCYVALATEAVLLHSATHPDLFVHC